MRKLSVIALLLAGGILNATPTDTLMLIGETPISSAEFEYVYKKNNQGVEGTTKSLDEYLTLYENFKLKVIEAQAQGLDTMPSFKSELDGYRNQLKSSYLTDKKCFDALVAEVRERAKEDIEVSHILFRVDEGAMPADTLAAYTRAQQAYERLQQGEEFGVVATSTSDDRMVGQNGGYLGYVTCRMLFYPFENLVYNQPVGVVSQPLRTPIGYHIILVHNRRKAAGEIHARHILKSATNHSMAESTKHEIDSLYQLLLAGANFEELAQKHSDDKGSAANGGDLSWFGLGRMVPAFERAAFALQHEGDISEPVLSPFGWHIIKLEERREKQFDVKETERFVMRDSRMRTVQESFVEQLKRDYNYVLDSYALDEVKRCVKLSHGNDSLLRAQCGQLNKTLFTFADREVLQVDFVMNTHGLTEGNLVQQLDAFVGGVLVQYEDAQLEQKYPDFANLMREYHDGIQLFDISNREVWERAAKDTIGQAQYFEMHRADYKFEQPTFKGYLVQCRNKKEAKMVKRILQSSHPDSIPSYVAHRINTDTVDVVRLQHGMWKRGDDVLVDKYAFKTKGKVKSTDEHYPVCFTVGEVITMPTNVADVRGRVVADYQLYLEQKWVEKLRAKYAVWVNPKFRKRFATQNSVKE